MTTATRISGLALAAGCLCTVHASTLGSASEVGARSVSVDSGPMIAVHVPGQSCPEGGEAPSIDPQISRVAFQQAQLLDASLQPVLVPPPDMQEVREQDARANDLGPAPFRIGVLMTPVGGNVSSSTDGIWDVLPDGTEIWTLVIQTPGARGSSIEFLNLDLPDGAMLLIRNSAGELQTWTGKGPNGNGYLQTPIIEGELAEVQYVAPPGVAGDPGILIDRVSHIYRLGALDPQDDHGSDDRVTYACHIDVMCPINGGNADPTSRDAVGAMFFSGNTICSGALLADLDPNTFKGWFLTANHCISTQAVVNTLTIYWKYQKPSCGGLTPSLASRPQSTGGTLISTSAQTDFCLIRTANDPYFPGHAAGSPTFAAWTSTAPANGSLVRGIHHPNFEYRRWSEGNTTVSGQICGGLSTSFFYYGDWKTTVDAVNPYAGGMTEGGSSGSPLFNSSWEVIGQLYGACFSGTGVACNSPSTWNWVYGRFNQTYANNAAVSTSLTLVQPDDAYEDNDVIGSPASIPLGSYPLVLIDFDDYFQITIDCPTTLTVSATFTTSEMDLDLYLYNQFDSLVSSQTGTGSPKTIVAAVNPGTYKIRAGKTSGWGGAYTLNMSIAPSCVVEGVCCFQCNHILAPNSCPDPTNFVQSFCDEVSEATCVSLGGQYRGDGTTCATLANACLCPGDVNGDGDTNVSDFNIVAGNFGAGGPGCLTRSQGDLNCDGIVNVSDFNIMASSFGCDGN